MKSNRYTLRQLNLMVREAIELSLPDEYWVEAELSECRESRGHCYMELIEKDPSTATPVARASAKCWASTWQFLRPHFERSTGQKLRGGLKVLLKVYAQYHEAYGFSWIVTDIDPNYTLGDMMRRRMEIISQLKDEGVFDLQRELTLPLFCQHIAVISSATAAGYGDFLRHLEESRYAFHADIFPAIMQGEQVEQSIISALNEIYGKLDNYDCVVIIRGGGATADLSGFDTLLLAEHVANFPLPIITGIGHERDECVLDMISHLRVKTPTAAASMLIERLQNVDNTLTQAQTSLVRHTQQRLSVLNTQLTSLTESIPHLFAVVKTRQEALVHSLRQRLNTSAERIVYNEQHKIELLEEKARSLDPLLMLKRGYSITRKDGHAVRDASELRDGDQIETRLYKGKITSTVLT